MKRRKWIIGIAAVLLVLFAVKGIAHYRWSRLSAEEKAGTITEKMAHRFDLSPDQKGKIYAINLEKIQSVETACKSGGHRRADWKQQHEQWRNAVREVLTPEQQQKFRH